MSQSMAVGQPNPKRKLKVKDEQVERKWVLDSEISSNCLFVMRSGYREIKSIPFSFS